MAFLERRAGCAPGDSLCMGPEGPYWTLLGTPLAYVWVHAIPAAALALVVGILLVALRKKGRLAWSARGVALAIVAAALVGFLASAALFPFDVQY